MLGLGRLGDILIAITTSRRSPNILNALRAARANGIATVGFTGKTGGDLAALCELCPRAPSHATPLIQQLHMTAGHILCTLAEERLFPRIEAAPGLSDAAR